MMKRLMIPFMAISLLGCATTQKSVSVEELQMRLSDMENQIEQKSLEIDDLRVEVSELNTKLKGISVRSDKKASPPAVKNIPNQDKETVRVAATVQEVQTSLKNAGFYTGPMDGKIGEKTKTAIKAFQEANGLTADGVIGQKTWNQLKSYLY